MVFRFSGKKNSGREWPDFSFIKEAILPSAKNFEKSSGKIGKSAGLIPRPLESPELGFTTRTKGVVPLRVEGTGTRQLHK